MRLTASETILVGKWAAKDGRVVADTTVARIEHLTNSHLVGLAHGADGWDTLYRDPDDGRLWERVYLESHLHGGGPPTLRHISLAAAAEKYRIELNQPES